jgi:hypothetical protein
MEIDSTVGVHFLYSPLRPLILPPGTDNPDEGDFQAKRKSFALEKVLLRATSDVLLAQSRNPRDEDDRAWYYRCDAT